MPLKHPAFNILYHHNAVINQQTQSYHQSDNTQLIQVKTKKLEQDYSYGQGKWNRDHHNHSRTNPQGQ
ncbi:hypothetical protein D3C85_1402900 [compost metagenome]